MKTISTLTLVILSSITLLAAPKISVSIQNEDVYYRVTRGTGYVEYKVTMLQEKDVINYGTPKKLSQVQLWSGPDQLDETISPPGAYVETGQITRNATTAEWAKYEKEFGKLLKEVEFDHVIYYFHAEDGRQYKLVGMTNPQKGPNSELENLYLLKDTGNDEIVRVIPVSEFKFTPPKDTAFELYKEAGQYVPVVTIEGAKYIPIAAH